VALKILLADDSMTAQNMGKKILTDAGYEVVAVSNGAAAVKKIAETNPSLCILDIYMPGYSGLEVCEKIKSSAATTRIPVLLTVGKHEPYKPEDGARVRADGVIVKPFEASELLRAVHRFSQRAAGSTPARAPIGIPPAPPSAPPATYERTVKLTREQIQEYMDPGLASWKRGTTGAVASTQTASTADGMPAFTVAAVEEKDPPSLAAKGHEMAAMVDLDPNAFAIDQLREVLPLEKHREVPEQQAPNASVVLAGFVDYLIAQGNLQANDEPLFAMTELPTQEAPASSSKSEPAQTGEVTETEPPVAAPNPPLVDVTPEHWATVAATGYQVPEIDPALEVAPPVTIVPTPDPDFEAPQDIPVANATEEGLQPTSRSEESKGVETIADPNLSPMEGLIDAVQPLEGGRLVIPQTEAGVAEAIPEPAAPIEPAPASASSDQGEAQVSSMGSSKKSKKTKEMRPIPAPPATAEEPVETGEATVPPKPKGDVTEEIAAVLDLLGQTTAVVVPAAVTDTTAPSEEVHAPAAASARVWMAEEVALSDVEATWSLEHEMRIASGAIQDSKFNVEAEDSSTRKFGLGQSPEAAVAVAEEPMRDEKITSHSAGPDAGGLPPGSGASPTQELAAAMAAAFGGALPQEDLARAEETQSISEEVRRFALGDAYKPTFGGAAIEEPQEKPLDAAKLSAAIERAIDRLKPQIIAEILKELQAPSKQ
jgi:CheY-like chemotaxis protein